MRRSCGSAARNRRFPTARRWRGRRCRRSPTSSPPREGCAAGRPDMAVEIILPRVDMDMATGRFTRWFFAEGDVVAKGEPLFEIETDKAAMEVDAPASGILRGTSAKPGDVLPVGGVIGWLYTEGEAFVEASRAAVPAKPAEPAPSV